MPESSASPQRLLLVTGLLGAGKTTVLKVLEDLGWEAIDNFPIRLLGRLLDSPDGPGGDLRAPLAIGFRFAHPRVQSCESDRAGQAAG
jgi:UPF0042 nucleotide-binding protein